MCNGSYKQAVSIQAPTATLNPQDGGHNTRLPREEASAPMACKIIKAARRTHTCANSTGNVSGANQSARANLKTTDQDH